MNCSLLIDRILDFFQLIAFQCNLLPLEPLPVTLKSLYQLNHNLKIRLVFVTRCGEDHLVLLSGESRANYVSDLQ